MEAYTVSLTKSSRFRNKLIPYFTGEERMIDFGKSYRHSKIGFYASSIFNFKLERHRKTKENNVPQKT